MCVVWELRESPTRREKPCGEGCYFPLFVTCEPPSLRSSHFVFPTLSSSFPHPQQSRMSHPACFRGRALRPHNVRVHSGGQPLRLLRFMPQVLVSGPLLTNSSVLHQKPLKNLANRMAANWNNCLVIFYVHCYIHVCMCLCGWSVGDSEKILTAYKANDDWEEFSMPEQQTPSPLGMKLILIIWNNTSSMQQNLPLG